MIIESLRCPYCLGPVEIRQGDNWTVYWCSQHGAIESPISFTDTALASGRISSPVPFHRRELAISRHLFSPFAGGGLFRIFPDASGRYVPFSGHKSDNCAVGCIARGFEQ